MSKVSSDIVVDYPDSFFVYLGTGRSHLRSTAHYYIAFGDKIHWRKRIGGEYPNKVSDVPVPVHSIDMYCEFVARSQQLPDVLTHTDQRGNMHTLALKVPKQLPKNLRQAYTDVLNRMPEVLLEVAS